jgi:geranylgeranyl reductase family protein
MYDVIIVGSGPAGSTAAYFLGEAGKRVLLLEKERLPRYKLCGGGLSIRFLREQFPFSFDSIVKNDVSAVSYIFGESVNTIPLAPDAITMVMRDEFDQHLLRHTSAEVKDGTAVRSVKEYADRVVVETSRGEVYEAACLIGADGANSIVARSIGLRPRRLLAAAVEAEVPATPELLQRFGQEMVFIFGEIHYGYLWIFPKKEYLTVGIGALRPKRGELQACLKRVMARYGISLENIPLHGHPIPIFTRFEKISTRRILLAGDAAGLADQLSGEGIRFAIKSGRLAAETILSGRTERYPRDLFWSIGLNHFFTTLVSLLFYYFQFPFFFFGTPNPFSTQAVVEMIADRRTAVGFIFYGFFTLPVFGLTELAFRCCQRLGLPKLAQNIKASIYPRDVSSATRQQV